MSIYLNKATIIGDIVDPPKPSKYSDSKSVLFRLLLERAYTSRDGEKHTSKQYITCVTSDKLGQTILSDTSFKAGAKVLVEGSLSSRKNEEKGTWDTLVYAYQCEVFADSDTKGSEIDPSVGF